MCIRSGWNVLLVLVEKTSSVDQLDDWGKAWLHCCSEDTNCTSNVSPTASSWISSLCHTTSTPEGQHVLVSVTAFAHDLESRVEQTRDLVSDDCDLFLQAEIAEPTVGGVGCGFPDGAVGDLRSHSLLLPCSDMG